MPSHPYKFSNTWYGKVNKQIILYIFSKIYIYIYKLYSYKIWHVQFLVSTLSFPGFTVGQKMTYTILFLVANIL